MSTVVIVLTNSNNKSKSFMPNMHMSTVHAVYTGTTIGLVHQRNLVAPYIFWPVCAFDWCYMGPLCWCFGIIHHLNLTVFSIKVMGYKKKRAIRWSYCQHTIPFWPWPSQSMIYKVHECRSYGRIAIVSYISRQFFDSDLMPSIWHFFSSYWN